MQKEYKNINEFVEDVHNEISIRDAIVGMDIVKDEWFTKNSFLNCIFHNGDHSPSLQVGEHFFKCYACGAKGDIFKFLQLHYNISFIEATEKLAEYLGVSIKTANFSSHSKSKELLTEWNMYLNDMDNASKDIQELRRDYFPQQIGYDKKINYIVLPFTSKTGSILGFTKRRVGDDKNNTRPKWKHSSLDDSLIGSVHNVFNLSIAAPEIKKKDEVIMTEGPKDVIAYQRIGKNNTICTCGTNNSVNSFDIIMPVKNIVTSMDNDKSGIHATIDIIKFLGAKVELDNVECVVLPEGKDPYDVTKSELANFYENRVKSYVYLMMYGDDEEIKDVYSKASEFNKQSIIREICKHKGFNLIEAKSWLKNKETNNKEEMSEKDRLIAIVECKDIDGVEYIDPEKAKKILKMKYGLKY